MKGVTARGAGRARPKSLPDKKLWPRFAHSVTLNPSLPHHQGLTVVSLVNGSKLQLSLIL